MQIVFQKSYDENISANDHFRELRDHTRVAEMGAKQTLRIACAESKAIIQMLANARVRFANQVCRSIGACLADLSPNVAGGHSKATKT